MITTTMQARKLKLDANKMNQRFKTTEPGLVVRAYKNGQLKWVSRRMVAGKRVEQTLGNVQEITFQEAKEKFRKQADDLVVGIDPKSRQRKMANTLNNTFEKLAAQFIAELKLNGDITELQIQSYENYLLKNADVEKYFFGRSVKGIDGEEFFDFLLELKAGNLKTLNTVGRVRSMKYKLSGFYSWLAKNAKVSHNPIKSMTVPQSKPVKRVLSETEIKTLWNYNFPAGQDGKETRFSTMTKLFFATGGMRESAIKDAEKTEIHNNVWTIPASRMKRKGKAKLDMDNTIPVTPLIQKLLDELPKTNSKFLFPGKIYEIDGKRQWRKGHYTKNFFWGDQPISKARNSLRNRWKKETGIDDLQPNKFIRKTCATLMASKLGLHSLDINIVQGRISDQNSGAANHYNFSDYNDKKRKILEDWNQCLETIFK